MSEANLWQDLRFSLSPFGQLKRIENLVDKGTPDVAYVISDRVDTIHGWLELKHLDSWPSRARTPVLLPSLMKEQVMWIEEWERAGGNAAILLRVGDRQGIHMLLGADLVRAVYDRDLTKEELLTAAIGRWSEGFIPGQIVRWIVGR